MPQITRAVAVVALAQAVLRIEEQTPGERGRLKAVRVQDLGERGLIGADMIVGADRMMMIRVLRGQQRRKAGQGPVGLAGRALEKYRLFRQTIDVRARWTAVAIGAQMIRPKRVDGYDEDIERRRLRRAGFGARGGP